MTATVYYQIATYSGIIDVHCNPDDEEDVIKSRARNLLSKRYGPLPFGLQEFRVVNRKD
jgi:hypothetical protein